MGGKGCYSVLCTGGYVMEGIWMMDHIYQRCSMIHFFMVVACNVSSVRYLLLGVICAV